MTISEANFAETLRRDDSGRIVYEYRGGIERGNGKPGYDWHSGFSPTTKEGHVVYPWLTKRECQRDAKRYGSKAVFVNGGVPYAY